MTRENLKKYLDVTQQLRGDWGKVQPTAVNDTFIKNNNWPYNDCIVDIPNNKWHNSSLVNPKSKYVLYNNAHEIYQCQHLYIRIIVSPKYGIIPRESFKKAAILIMKFAASNPTNIQRIVDVSSFFLNKNNRQYLMKQFGGVSTANLIEHLTESPTNYPTKTPITTTTLSPTVSPTLFSLPSPVFEHSSIFSPRSISLLALSLIG